MCVCVCLRVWVCNTQRIKSGRCYKPNIHRSIKLKSRVIFCLCATWMKSDCLRKQWILHCDLWLSWDHFHVIMFPAESVVVCLCMYVCMYVQAGLSVCSLCASVSSCVCGSVGLVGWVDLSFHHHHYCMKGLSLCISSLQFSLTLSVCV